ncbi:Sulfatase-modifying factor 2 [Gossypium arboreum]|uniref:Sulfatase-modifying factor 2 n=1 Tax=Gossypium arboreum TaxID=29729 RepID=A0A0B0MI12_GOSAR|nr:Sulfatase-modifying factor 2 [Gossypium arboreum]
MRWTGKRLPKQEEFQSKSRPGKTGQIWTSLKIFALFLLHDNEQRGAAVEAQITRAQLQLNPLTP